MSYRSLPKDWATATADSMDLINTGVFLRDDQIAFETDDSGRTDLHPGLRRIFDTCSTVFARMLGGVMSIYHRIYARK